MGVKNEVFLQKFNNYSENLSNFPWFGSYFKRVSMSTGDNPYRTSAVWWTVSEQKVNKQQTSLLTARDCWPFTAKKFSAVNSQRTELHESLYSTVIGIKDDLTVIKGQIQKLLLQGAMVSMFSRRHTQRRCMVKICKVSACTLYNFFNIYLLVSAWIDGLSLATLWMHVYTWGDFVLKKR